jgi:hypothetical protein
MFNLDKLSDIIEAVQRIAVSLEKLVVLAEKSQAKQENHVENSMVSSCKNCKCNTQLRVK